MSSFDEDEIENKLTNSEKEEYRKNLVQRIFKIVDEKFPNISNNFKEKEKQSQEPFSEKAYFKFIMRELGKLNFEYETEITGDMCRSTNRFSEKIRQFTEITEISDFEIESALQVYNFCYKFCIHEESKKKIFTHVKFICGPGLATMLEPLVLLPDEDPYNIFDDLKYSVDCDGFMKKLYNLLNI
jgi:hypothetical protein